MNEIYETQLMMELVSNGLPQVPNKTTAAQNMSILFLYKGIGADS